MVGDRRGVDFTGRAARGGNRGLAGSARNVWRRRRGGVRGLAGRRLRRDVVALAGHPPGARRCAGTALAVAAVCPPRDDAAGRAARGCAGRPRVAHRSGAGGLRRGVGGITHRRVAPQRPVSPDWHCVVHRHSQPARLAVSDGGGAPGG